MLGSLTSYRTYRQLFVPPYGEPVSASTRAPVALRVRQLGYSVRLRPGTSDGEVLWETFAGAYHRPPPSVAQEARVVWDLGANIGLTTADLASLMPRARLIGVELDEENVVLARGNVAPYAERCTLIHAAAWIADGTVAYEPQLGNEFGLHVAESETSTTRRVPALSLDSLLSQTPGRCIDYVKMDVEGAEQRLLRQATSWARFVGCMKVEVHEPYSVDACVYDLRALGFTPAVDARHWACVLATRR
jgi:FkbM family methyltransferase